MMRKDALLPALLMTALSLPASMTAQTSGAGTGQMAAAPRQSGTVKAVTPHDFVLTNAAGQDFAITVPSGARILLVDPGTRDLKTARPGTMSDVGGGDKAIVIGTPGDSGQTLTASRVLLLKSGDIAALHAEQKAEWARSIGGLVRSTDDATGTITVVNGTRLLTIKTTPSTVLRRYAPGSVRFEDAGKSDLAAIKPGDQVQARGQHSADGMTLTADEIVSGSFINVSGNLTAVDSSAGTVTLTDLKTKHPVTVLITSQTNLRKMPAAARPAGSGREAADAGSERTAGHANAGTGEAHSPAGSGRMDLTRMVGRLPTENLADLKPGDAVIIVASRDASGGEPVGITLVSGVGQILASSPAGETTLSPWSLGSSEGEGGEGGEAGAGGR